MAQYSEEVDYAPEPVSDPEKLAIATHMLMTSPPGQFWDVLTGMCLRGSISRPSFTGRVFFSV